MKIPDKVKIGCYTIKIIPMLGFEGFAHGVLGHFSEAEMCIRISKDVPKEVLANTLLHEVFHACYSVAGLREEDDEERIVTCMANTYLQVMTDNPSLDKFIKACYKNP
jgi:hypothetical protein